MVTAEQVRQLLSHRGSIWYVAEKEVPGFQHVCPRCEGKCTVEVSKSDAAYSRWTETVTCTSCNGIGRTDKQYVVQEVERWEFSVSSGGIEFDYWLKTKQIFLSEDEARRYAVMLSRARPFRLSPNAGYC